MKNKKIFCTFKRNYVPLQSVFEIVMKKDIHPDYHFVVFWDMSSDYKFLTRSTATSRETITWEDGNTYPVVKVDISSKSHPFYTGKKVLLDSAGRVDKFNKRYNKKK